MQGKFELGCVVTTRGVHDKMAEEPEFREFVMMSMDRYKKADWGDSPSEDKDLNNEALTCGDRIFATYISPSGVKIWIITESDRSATTVLFPDEY